MLEYLSQLSQSKLILSAGVLLLLLIVRRSLTASAHRRFKNDNERKRRWSSGIKNISSLLMMVGLASVWFDEIQNFAISIAAFVVAIVLATREYIQCLLASLYQATARQYRVGDWVEVDGVAGEVANTDWITTSLYELSINCGKYQFTGRTLIIPNNLFITRSFTNLNYMRRYVNHSFYLVSDKNEDALSMQAHLQNKLDESCADFRETADRYRSMIERKLEITIPGEKNKVQITTTDLGHIKYSFSFFCPTEQAKEIEQLVTLAFFTYRANLLPVEQSF
ncbi:mechanosensitive ion channel MscS [Catenovulum agarivorans DS-2]|uniref:Mechanosensitive ion channel MscS n=1 Tax=Catenovulum agarivorans DS-2 TaxID=1328313 RepID=W7R0W8_9ALTE|nr:mechanosensitive ion channel family protein [Catenovulum agarivorans]EWH11245.1 mechanosensitive ion channel MscS [Catenovulum agarivorans DS-2]